jgi:hypothetical protein
MVPLLRKTGRIFRWRWREYRDLDFVNFGKLAFLRPGYLRGGTPVFQPRK